MMNIRFNDIRLILKFLQISIFVFSPIIGIIDSVFIITVIPQ
jgi:hypothetical protein